MSGAGSVDGGGSVDTDDGVTVDVTSDVEVDDEVAVDVEEEEEEDEEVDGVDATASPDDAGPELHAVSATSTRTTMHPAGDFMTGP